MPRRAALDDLQHAGDRHLHRAAQQLIAAVEQAPCRSFQDFRTRVAGGEFKDLVRFGWHCLWGRRHRRSWRDVQAAVAAGSTRRWYTTFLRNVYATYTHLHHLRHPTSVTDDVVQQFGNYVPRRLRRLLRQRGLSVSNADDRVSNRTRANAKLLVLWDRMQEWQHVIWFDNFFKPRVMANPYVAYATFNSTCVSVLRTDAVSPLPYAHCTYHQGQLNVDAVAHSVKDAFIQLWSMVRQVRSTALTGQDVRVPLDVHRGPRPTLPWTPFLLTRASVGQQEGLLKVLALCVDAATRSRARVTPILVDENLHYRLLRLAWTAATSPWDVQRYMRKVPVLFGIWHAYKYLAIQTYRSFHPVLAILQKGNVPAGSAFPTGPKLRTLELMFSAVLLQDQGLLDAIRNERRAADAKVQQEKDTAAICTQHHFSDAAHSDVVTPGSSLCEPTLVHDHRETVCFHLLCVFAFWVKAPTWHGHPNKPLHFFSLMSLQGNVHLVMLFPVTLHFS